MEAATFLFFGLFVLFALNQQKLMFITAQELENQLKKHLMFRST